MPDRCRFTTAYRFVDQDRLVFAYTCDPVHLRSRLQSNLRVRLSLMAFYRGRLLPSLRARFADICHGGKRNGCFELTSDLVDYLKSIPQVYTAPVSRKHARGTVRAGKHAIVYERVLEDLPDRAALPFIAGVIGVTRYALRKWALTQELLYLRDGSRILIDREELRYWLRARGKLIS